jgi:hypothetical protein
MSVRKINALPKKFEAEKLKEEWTLITHYFIYKLNYLLNSLKIKIYYE